MVNLVTRYDNNLNEKTFMLKGDEAYARTTDTLLKIIRFPDSLNHLNGMRVGLSIDVLRDIGDSTVVLYDNDEVIGVYNWNHGGWGRFSKNNIELEVEYRSDNTQLTSPGAGIAWYLYNKLINGDFTVELELSHQGPIRLSCTGSPTKLNQIGTIQVSTGNPNNSTNTIMYVPQDNVFYNVKYERVGEIINCYLMVDNEWVLCSTRPITTNPIYFGFFIYQNTNAPFNKKINFKNLTIKQNNQIIFADKGGLNTNNYNKLNIGSEEDLNSGLWLGYDIEHNIYAKYMGNKKCLKSQSKTESFIEPTPSKYLTNLMFINPFINHDSNTNVDFQLRIQSSEYCVLSKSVKVYVDNQLHSTVSVPPNGLKNIRLSGLNDGKHVIRAVFEGDDESVADDVCFEFSVGYIIRWEQVPKAIVYNDEYMVKVHVKNYLMDNMSGVDVSFNGLYPNISCPNGVTDSNGFYSTNIKLLENINHDSYINLQADVKGSLSELKMVSLYKISHLFVGRENRVIFPTQNNIIHAGVDLNNSSFPKDNIKIVLKLNDKYWKTVYTNEDGEISVPYIGTGAGEIWVSGTAGGKTKGTLFYDVLQYWNVELDMTDLVIGLENIHPTVLKDGFKFKLLSDTGVLSIYDMDRVYDFDWNLIFSIISISEGTQLLFGAEGNDYLNYNNTFNSGDRIMIKKSGDYLTLYINGVEKNKIPFNSTNQPKIKITGGKNKYMILNDLMFMKA